MWWKGMRRRVATAWRSGNRHERLRLVVSLPWLGVIRASGLIGWYSARLGVRPTSPTDAPAPTEHGNRSK
jgi:hypothetical protein